MDTIKSTGRASFRYLGIQAQDSPVFLPPENHVAFEEGLGRIYHFWVMVSIDKADCLVILQRSTP